VEGLARYPLNLRYARGLRDNIESLKRILIATPTGAQIPIAQVAEIKVRKGPPAIKTENARLNAWVYVDIKGIDVGTYVKNAKKAVNDQVNIPPGYSITWSGQYEYMERASARLRVVVPITLAIIFLLLYLNFANITESLIVMFSIPFALVGGIWLMYFLGYDFSVAVWVGFIALAGLAAETGIVMLVYLDHVYDKRKADGKILGMGDIHTSIIEGAVERVRPKLMTVATTIFALLPIMIGTGTGSLVMKRIAAPMVGGLISSTILTLIIIPVVYAIWKGIELKIDKKPKKS